MDQPMQARDETSRYSVDSHPGCSRNQNCCTRENTDEKYAQTTLALHRHGTIILKRYGIPVPPGVTTCAPGASSCDPGDHMSFISHWERCWVPHPSWPPPWIVMNVPPGRGLCAMLKCADVWWNKLNQSPVLSPRVSW